MDLISQHVADHQAKWEQYLAKHDIEKLYREMTTALLDTQPDDPKQFLFDYMKRQFQTDAPEEGQVLPVAPPMPAP